jgi:hypothetical protein
MRMTASSLRRSSKILIGRGSTRHHTPGTPQGKRMPM